MLSRRQRYRPRSHGSGRPVHRPARRPPWFGSRRARESRHLATTAVIAIHGERTRAVAGGVGRGATAAGAKHHHFGQPLGLSRSNAAAIDDIVPVQQADRHRVGHPGCSHSVVSSPTCVVDLGAVAQVDGHHRRMGWQHGWAASRAPGHHGGPWQGQRPAGVAKGTTCRRGPGGRPPYRVRRAEDVDKVGITAGLGGGRRGDRRPASALPWSHSHHRGSPHRAGRPRAAGDWPVPRAPGPRRRSARRRVPGSPTCPAADPRPSPRSPNLAAAWAIQHGVSR